MTIEEAIKHCMDIAETQEMCSNGKKCAEEHRQLAEWLKELKALKEKEPCDDCISRQAVKDMLMREWTRYIPMDLDVNLSFVLAKVDELPSVTPQPKTGHWSRKTKVDAYDIAGVKTWGIKCQCDRCDCTTIVVEDFGYYNYCPNCGAKMAESEDRT